MFMGLCISSLVNTTDKATALTPIILIPQVILSGAIVKLKGISLYIAKITMLSYWSFEMIKHSLSKNTLEIKDILGKLIIKQNEPLVYSYFAIFIFSLFFIIISMIGLKRQVAHK